MSGRNVSLVVWRDPKTDPPPLKRIQFILALWLNQTACLATNADVAEHPDDYYAWAELPTPSDATTDDLERSWVVASCALNPLLSDYPPEQADVEAVLRFGDFFTRGR